MCGVVTRRERDVGEQKTLTKQRVSSKVMYARGFSSLETERGNFRARDHLENSYFHSPSPYACNDAQYTCQSAKNSCCVHIHEEKMANTKYIKIASVSTASVNGPVCFSSVRQQVGRSSFLQSSSQQFPSLLPSPGP